MNLDEILNMFKKDDPIYNHILNLKVDDTWIILFDTVLMNKKYSYNQNYTLVVDRGDIYITNWEHLDTDKFYKFQDKYTYKNMKSAIKAFIKLSIK